MNERNGFQNLRAWILPKKLALRQIFWITGAITFFISPEADNLASALLISTVVLAISGNNTKFLIPSLVNIVVAANA